MGNQERHIIYNNSNKEPDKNQETRINVVGLTFIFMQIVINIKFYIYANCHKYKKRLMGIPK